MSPLMDLHRRALRLAAKMASLFFVVTLVWILGSDALALYLSSSTEEYNRIQNFKGVFFISAMAIAIGWMTYRLFIAHEHEARARLLSTTDIVTQLRNQRAFNEELALCLRHFTEPFGLIFVDALQFSRINASLGRDRGDLLLFRMGRRVRMTAGDDAIVARFEADKFAILTPPDKDPARVERIAEAVLEALNREFPAGDHAIKLEVFGGYVTVSPGDRPQVPAIISAADSALERAKQGRIQRLIRFDPGIEETRSEQFEIEMELRSALQKGELDVHFQPQVRLTDGSIRGAEALVRWPHPEKGMISPGVFIPVAEQSGLIDAIGKFVIHRSFERMRSLAEAGINDLVISINAAGHQLDGGQLPTLLREAATQWQQPLDKVEIEVTETMALQKPEASIRYLQELRDLGVTVALDDFGTGVSSLQYLLNLPVDVLKIDRSFIASLPEDQRQARFVRTIIDLGRDLDMEIIAEGVETEGQRALLAEMGCQVAQGFYLARPMAAGAFRQWIEARAKKT